MSSQRRVDCRPPTVGVAKHAVSSLIDVIDGLVASTKVVGQTSGWRAGTSEGFGVAKLKIRRQIWVGPLQEILFAKRSNR